MLAQKDHPADCVDCRVIDEAQLLQSDHLDRKLGKPHFRDAWEDDGTAIRVNMPKARIIHMDQIRGVRDKELKELDLPYMKALEAGDTAEQQRIANQKQVLRDIPQTFDLDIAATPEDLKALWPQELP